jgi:hypothetical protein
VQLDNERAISTGKPRVTYAHWHGRNTLDLGAVNEDVQGITLSGQHTFPDQAIETALEALRLYPGHNLYLGIPPANPQKYVLVQNDVLSRDAQASPIVIPLNVRPQQDHSQDSEIDRGHRTPKNCRDYLLRTLYKATCGTLGRGSRASNNPAVAREQHTRRTHEERAAQLRQIGQEFNQRIDGIQFHHRAQPIRQTQAVIDEQIKPGSSSSPRLSAQGGEAVPSSSFQASTSSESIQNPLRTLAAGHTPAGVPATLMMKADSTFFTAVSSSETTKTAPESSRKNFSTQGQPRRLFTEPRVNASQNRTRAEWKDYLRREDLNDLQRPSEVDSLETAEMTSRQTGFNNGISFSKITLKNSRAAAVGALQRVIGTYPEFSSEIQQQMWVDLLNQALEARRTFESEEIKVRSGERIPIALSILATRANDSLRNLLEVSSTTDVFNFGNAMLPTSATGLDAFFDLPQFLWLAQGVNEVYTNMTAKRPHSGMAV